MGKTTKTDSDLNFYHAKRLGTAIRSARKRVKWTQEELALVVNKLLSQAKHDWIPSGFEDRADRYYVLYLERGTAAVPWASKTRLRAVVTALGMDWFAFLEKAGVLAPSDFSEVIEDDGSEQED